MIYELRTYKPAPGAEELLHKRFKLSILSFFKKHNIESVGFWTDSLNQLVYIVCFPDEEKRQHSWSSLRNDPEFLADRAKYEKIFGGPLVIEKKSELLKPTSYSTLN